jgi:2-oxoisovalerate dehydrogenase E1 component alpha subunit
VFVINNNEWAISVPRSAQSAAETLAQKGIAAGLPGEQVDGNDVIAVRAVLERALGHARRDRAPSLVEALTYRLSDHTTADDARRYRDDAEVSARWKAEPIARMRNFLTERGWWTKADEETLLQQCAGEIDAAVEAYLAAPPAPPTDIVDHLFAELPEAMVRQRAALVAGAPS